MSAETLNQLRAAGITLFLDGSDLVAGGPPAVLENFIPLLRAQKKELLAALSALVKRTDKKGQSHDEDCRPRAVTDLITGIIVACPRETSPSLGAAWCERHKDALLTVGWTEKELFNPRWPLGLALLGVWEIPGLVVSLKNGNVIFRIPKPNGTTVQQVARPQSSLFPTIH